MQFFLLLIVTHSLLIVATFGGNNFGDQPVCEQTKKWLKHSLNALNKCNNSTKQCAKSVAMTNITKELIDLGKNLLNKLSDSSKTVTRGEVKELLGKVNNYWTVLGSKMTKNVQTFDAYGTEFRFKKAMEIEKELETKCNVSKCNKQPIFCSKFCAEVEEDVEKELLEQIREAFQTVRILQLLATPKKQKEFNMHNDYVYNESLKKNYNVMSKIEEMPNAESEIEEMPNAESKIEEMPNADAKIEESPNADAKIEESPKGCAATKKVVSAANWWCHACDDGDQADDASSRSACIEAINCAICTPFCLTTMAVGCIFSVPIDTVNGICASIENAKNEKND